MDENNCSLTPPSSAQVLSDGSPENIALLCTSGIMALATVIIYFEQVLFIYRNMWTWKSRNKYLVLLGLYPVTGVTSFVTIIIPKSSTLVDLVASVYLSVCIAVFLMLMIEYYGGSERMIFALADHRIPLRSPPIACCICCLPKIQITEKALSRITLCVMQLAILRPVLMFIAAVLWSDGLYVPGQLQPDQPSMYITILNTISTLTAMYGLILIYRVSKKPLMNFNISAKFVSLQLVILFCNLQNVIINIFTGAGVIKCIPPFGSQVRGERIHHVFLTAEMLLLSCLALCAYKNERKMVKAERQSSSVSLCAENQQDPLKASANQHGYGALNSDDYDIIRHSDPDAALFIKT